MFENFFPLWGHSGDNNALKMKSWLRREHLGDK